MNEKNNERNNEFMKAEFVFVYNLIIYTVWLSTVRKILP